MALTTRKGNVYNNPSKVTRQQIPPFLSKLYHMVNDTNTDFLIRWSDAGDSFYVFDHERFAKEVLPHWFKHGNFGSFVRQLNNYGFHKVPHLQQGVLKSDAEIEVSHFENQNFQRGQADLLCLIQRKKQTPNDAREESPDVKEQVGGSSAQPNGAESEPTHTLHTSKGTVLDVNSIVNGIQAIKRHQQAISAELKDLHQSNQALWQEAYAARERHRKHNDTITRILKFLAGIFGQNGNNAPHAQGVPHEPSSNPSNSTAVVQRRQNRLMIENVSGSEGKTKEGVNGIPVIVNDAMEPLDFEGGQANDGDRFATVDTPISPRPSPAPSTPRPESGHLPSNPSSPQNLLHKSSNSTSQASQANHPTSTTCPFATSLQNRVPTPDLPPVLPSDFPFQSDLNSSFLAHNIPPDQIVQNTLASLMNNPAQLQRILAALQSQIPVSIPPDPGLEQAHVSAETAQSTPSLNFRPPNNSQLNPGSTLSLLSAASNMGTLSSTFSDEVTALNALAHNSDQLQKSYKDTSDVEADVNTLQGHIDSLIESLGLDPNTTAALRGEHQPQHTVDEIISSSVDGAHPFPPSQLSDINPDIDFEAFLSQDFDVSAGLGGLGPATGTFDATTQQNGAARLNAFLDEVRSVSNESDTVGSPPHGEPLSMVKETTATGSKKRKSDVMEPVDALTPEGNASRSKKRR